MISYVVCSSCFFWGAPSIPKSGPNPRPHTGMSLDGLDYANEHNWAVDSTKHHEPWRKISDFNSITYNVYYKKNSAWIKSERIPLLLYNSVFKTPVFLT